VGIDAEGEHDLAAGALEVDGMSALVEAISVAFVGARSPSRLRALDEDDPESGTATGL
jgi:hypothetical protein